MELIILPRNSFKKKDYDSLRSITLFAEKILKSTNIDIPKKVYFFNSFEDFSKKVLPEVKNYGFNEKEAEEIIKCALNNGTYGTINYKEYAVVEMNFNPFNKGEYSSSDFLAMIIHESLHLHISKKLNKDINNLKFRFKGNKFIGNEKIIMIDEGYAGFMTELLLFGINTKKIKNIKILPLNKESPKFNKHVGKLDIEKFDSDFEKILVLNRNKGIELFKKKFAKEKNIDKITDFAMNELKNLF
ncbi:MAG: hypothetical protein PHT91_03570 [Candidatus Nanoarchaeia archaeon]|nr:hypothetical protein [Candidatus Nanoarchaeia archaeon]MDD5499923.1 hypothetical protein [Candidatus Nanoarchaeia archaeon]